MAVGDPELNGDDAMLIVFKGGKKLVEDLLVSASAKPEIVQFKDKHIGYPNYRGDLRLRGWTVSLRYQYSSDELVQAVMSYYKAIQTPGIALPTWSIVLAVQQRNAAAQKPGYKFSPFYPVFDLDIGGQDERIKQGLEGFAEQWTPFVPLQAG